MLHDYSDDQNLMGKQLKLLHGQIMTASKNLKSVLVPALFKFVSLIYKLGGGDSINYFKKATLKATVRFLHGRRDHKVIYHDTILKRHLAIYISAPWVLLII